MYYFNLLSNKASRGLMNKKYKNDLIIGKIEEILLCLKS